MTVKVPKTEKFSPEKTINKALITLQETVRTKKRPERQEAFGALIKTLNQLPSQYRSLIMKIRFDPQDKRLTKYRTWLADIGILPLDDDRTTYNLHVLTPRKESMQGITAEHGSAAREKYFSSGEIETITTAAGYDPETEDDTALLINPANLGVLSTGIQFGKYWLFPRQIKEITPSEDLPSYLNENQRRFVEEFYSYE